MTSARHLPPGTNLLAARPGFVRVRGAREHNLRNVDVDIPRDALVVFTGVSGSGKSSLAFSTLYAEAQRRYFESVAPYARRLIDQVGVKQFVAECNALARKYGPQFKVPKLLRDMAAKGESFYGNYQPAKAA